MAQFGKISNFENAQWFTDNFKYSTIYNSVHEQCQNRLNDIVSKGYFIFRGEKQTVHTVIVQVTDNQMLVANVQRNTRRTISVKYEINSCANMYRNKQGQFDHYHIDRKYSSERRTSLSDSSSSEDELPDVDVWFRDRMNSVVQYHKQLELSTFAVHLFK